MKKNEDTPQEIIVREAFNQEPMRAITTHLDKIKKQSVVDHLTLIQKRGDEIMAAPADPRRAIIAEMLPKVKLTLKYIERGWDFARELDEIEILRAEANMVSVEPLARRGQKFIDGPKQPRMDALAETMAKAVAAFKEQHGRHPTAGELWDTIPTGRHVQEKEGEGTDRAIYWQRVNGSEEVTGFKAFQKRFTRIKKMLA